ncbi:uncharacterized protein EV420DRAFT_1770028, partial [Desarmillaria tabescens]
MDDIFVKRVHPDVPPLPPPPIKKYVLLKQQRFARQEPVKWCFVLSDNEDDDNLFFKPGPRNGEDSCRVAVSRSKLTFKVVGRWSWSWCNADLLPPLSTSTLLLSVHVHIRIAIYPYHHFVTRGFIPKYML